MKLREAKYIAFAVYPGVSALELIGPLTVLRDLRVGTPYRSIVVAGDAGVVSSNASLGLVPATTFDALPRPYAVIVPGGGSATRHASTDTALVDYVRTAAASADIVGSTGSGALVLGAAGLLTGRRVATHWAFADLVRASGATVVHEPWFDDGRLLTAAGGAAGIDLMLHLTARLRSRSAARLAQLWMEYDPQPPFGGLDPSSMDADLAADLRGESCLVEAIR
jgi:transcriptional regulator GlxA family with amidase domain